MSKIYSTYVPFVGSKQARILGIGEAPGEMETKGTKANGYKPEPFIGPAGDLLTQTLDRHGVPRQDIRLCNFSHYRPMGNDFKHLIDTPQLQEGIADIQREINEIKPNVILTFGAWPTYLLIRKLKMKKGVPVGIMHWRGSVLEYEDNPTDKLIKVIPSWHPSAVIRNGKNYPSFDNDIRRAVEQSQTRLLPYRDRKFVINPTNPELDEWEDLLIKSDHITVDIEAFGPKLACVGFAPSPDMGICVPFDSPARRDMIIRVLASNTPKIFHFGFFDILYLHEKGMKVNNWKDDTYVQNHALEPEMPNTLSFLTSFHTYEPYYKEEGREQLADKKSWTEKTTDKNVLYVYNCKDICCTDEVSEELTKELSEDELRKEVYDFEMELANGPIFHLSTTGFKINPARRALMKTALLRRWIKDQDTLNLIAKRPFVKKPQKIPGTDLYQLVNTNSGPQVVELLYQDLGVRTRRARGGSPSVDEAALISILAEAKKEMAERVTEDGKRRWKEVFIACKLILRIRGTRKLLSSYVNVDVSKDGRIRSAFKVGPETGRLAADKYVDGTGLNLMTIPRGDVEEVEIEDGVVKDLPLRSMFVSENGYVLVELDFSQAESWCTAYFAGEENMKDALKNGDIHTRSASLIYNEGEDVITKVQRYLGKKANHSLGYGSTYLRLAQSINAESDMPPFITITNPEAKVIYERWHQVYPAIKDWWNEIQRKLEFENRTLITPYNRPRTFYGNWGKDLFKEAYADLPQSTVADHTNGKVCPELGVEGGMLVVDKRFVEPGYVKLVNMAHDSIIVEMRQEDTSDLIPQIYNLMLRPLVIKREEFTIPVDVKVGEIWGQLEKYEVKDGGS